MATETIVVGVDGSDGSLQALRWAAGEARVRRARLRIVTAWDAPLHVLGPVWTMAGEDELAVREGLMLERLDGLLEAHAAELEGLEVERKAVHGPAAPALIAAAEGAAQLVLGTRGYGGFVGLLLGSVSQQCAHHAPCPVVIVPAEGAEGA